MNKHTGWIALSPKLYIRFEQKWNDIWIGVYWSRTNTRLDIWLCILPTLPIHIQIQDYE